MQIKSTIYFLYEVFSRGVSSDKFVWTATESTDKAVDRFVERWDKRGIKKESLGISFLYDYFCDSYNFWTNSGRELKVVPLNWIIGEPQLARWDKRYEEYKYSYVEGLLSHISIPTLSHLKAQLSPSPKPREHQLEEEYERQRFHNKPEGFINCLLETTLCSNESKWCSSCIYRDECIKELCARDKRTALKRGFIKL